SAAARPSRIRLTRRDRPLTTARIRPFPCATSPKYFPTSKKLPANRCFSTSLQAGPAGLIPATPFLLGLPPLGLEALSSDRLTILRAMGERVVEIRTR